MKLILASKSVARINMLKSAGLQFETHPSDIDETTVQNSGKAPDEIAEKLAAQKALNISALFPDALVIGADQVLECEGKLLNKASNEQEAREKLKTLRGQTHHLISAVCVAQGNEILWQNRQSASLTMHAFDDDFLERYIEQAGEALTRSVGAYELESLGVRLLKSVQGDYFTVLGMPLLSLLEYLQSDQDLKL